MGYLHIIEEHIKENLNAESVFIKIKSIDRKGKLHVTTKVKIKYGCYLKTPLLPVSNLLKSSPKATSLYIEHLLYPVKNGSEYLKTHKAFRNRE